MSVGDIVTLAADANGNQAQRFHVADDWVLDGCLQTLAARAVDPAFKVSPAWVYAGGAGNPPVSLYWCPLAEGVLLFFVLWLLDRRAHARGWYWDGLLTGAFLVGYALLRFLLEFTRQPDAQLGFIVLGKFSMGQLLSTIMLLVGVAVLAASRYRASRDLLRHATETEP